MLVRLVDWGDGGVVESEQDDDDKDRDVCCTVLHLISSQPHSLTACFRSHRLQDWRDTVSYFKRLTPLVMVCWTTPQSRSMTRNLLAVSNTGSHH
jgi:hypothetical protein